MSRLFPQDLLKADKVERSQYFQGVIVNHGKLSEVIQKVYELIINPSSQSSIITVIGPTGVGKSTLIPRIEKLLIERSLEDKNFHPGRIPVVSLEAASPSSGNFDWKDYHYRALVAMEEPLIDYKIDYSTQEVYRDVNGKVKVRSTASTNRLRHAQENALQHRQPYAVILDEAQHIQKMSSGRRLQDNMDCLKSIANITTIPHVLIGTYELLMMRNLSGQLSRRNQEVHFPRYKANSESDQKTFRAALQALTFYYMPMAEENNLDSEWKYCYERSLGCVGILKDWLSRALNYALDEGSEKITKHHLENTALTVAQCQKIVIEIIEGEKLLEGSPSEVDKLRTLLELDEESVKKLEKKPDSNKRGRRIGTPDPVRRTSHSDE
ncbi:ATP-binding protein [Nodosilinea sp. FACHB-13]|uniref:AAA family ATPase n=1 Tax=Cyanophyceae TaxID=3028117 RepID=UPI00168750D9|nr:ATP-binding protein [Nodosilinea sp. FACHB-13]MBD2106053.1 ATP-binding protein [Nodosilinea sp. FACHB-13]